MYIKYEFLPFTFFAFKNITLGNTQFPCVLCGGCMQVKLSFCVYIYIYGHVSLCVCMYTHVSLCVGEGNQINNTRYNLPVCVDTEIGLASFVYECRDLYVYCSFDN